MKKIADYDTYDYDYSTYWKKREYEHISEEILLKNLFAKLKGQWFLDIGGSFGRLTDSYYNNYSNPVIVDYSLKTLQKNSKDLKKRFPRIELIAANAYNLPFKESTFDGALMVRVLHHIDRPKDCLAQIYRILTPNGKYIQEYANKVHIKAVIRALIHFDLSIFNTTPYQQPDKHHYEGTKEGSKVLFLNYHPKYISDMFNKIGLRIDKKYGCSFLRSAFLKQTFKTETLLSIEKLLQKTLSWSNISPSIFLRATAIKKEKEIESAKNIFDICVCPVCKERLSFDGKSAKCKSCNKEYFKKEDIWDFRV